jgi:hypothetical protein
MKRKLAKLGAIVGAVFTGLAFLLVSAEFMFYSNDVVYEQTHNLENGETLIARKVESKSSVLKIVQYRTLTWTVKEDATTLVSYCGNTGFVNRVMNFVLGHGATLSGGSRRDSNNRSEFYVDGVKVKDDSSYWGNEVIISHMDEACSNV